MSRNEPKNTKAIVVAFCSAEKTSRTAISHMMQAWAEDTKAITGRAAMEAVYEDSKKQTWYLSYGDLDLTDGNRADMSHGMSPGKYFYDLVPAHELPALANRLRTTMSTMLDYLEHLTTDLNNIPERLDRAIQGEKP